MGNWTEVRRFVNRLVPSFEAEQKRTLKRFGLKLEGTVKTHISNQDLNWAPLSEWWLNVKADNNYSFNHFVATSTYFQAITSWVKADTAYIGVKRGTVGDNEESLGTIAYVLENGYAPNKLPARPLWAPSLKETKEWLSKKENDPAANVLRKWRSGT